MNHPQRHILITGTGSGLGRGLSLWLAQQGHSLESASLAEMDALWNEAKGKE